MSQIAQALPLCCDPIRDVWLQSRVARSVDMLLCEIGARALEAIILTGSTSRGEASVLPTVHGFRLLGDLEFLAILRSPIEWSGVRRRLAALSQQATQAMRAEGDDVSVEYGPAGLIYLHRNIRPSIFAYDLQAHGRVVWGQPNILTEIRPFGVEAIPREDALNLLMNRLVETLSLDIAATATEPVDVQHRAYHRAKVILDLAGSALAFVGHHASRYSERGHRFRTLIETEPSLHEALPEPDRFLAALNDAVVCKLDPTDENLTSLDHKVSEPLQAAWGRGLWLWEMRHLLGRPPSGFKDALEAYISRESRVARLKGWVKFLRHPLRPAHMIEWPRVLRLLLRASPQTLTYAMALLTQAGLAGKGETNWQQQLNALAPVPISNGGHAHVVREITTLWQWLMRNN
jgi:hypothetical protein